MSDKDKPLQELTDEMLMQRYSLGETEAFLELHHRHAPKLYGYLSKKLGNSSRVDDIFQETFLRLHRFRSKYDPSLPFVPWLFTLCRNTWLDDQRKQSARANREVELEKTLEQEEGISSLGVVAQQITFQSYLNGLSERERRVLTLHLENGFSFKEIGSWLKISPANARKLSSRAIQKLKALWE